MTQHTDRPVVTVHVSPFSSPATYRGVGRLWHDQRLLQKAPVVVSDFLHARHACFLLASDLGVKVPWKEEKQGKQNEVEEHVGTAVVCDQAELKVKLYSTPCPVPFWLPPKINLKIDSLALF